MGDSRRAPAMESEGTNCHVNEIIRCLSQTIVNTADECGTLLTIVSVLPSSDNFELLTLLRLSVELTFNFNHAVSDTLS